jgi:hypothetical protein
MEMSATTVAEMELPHQGHHYTSIDIERMVELERLILVAEADIREYDRALKAKLIPTGTELR